MTFGHVSVPVAADGCGPLQIPLLTNAKHAVSTEDRLHPNEGAEDGVRITRGLGKRGGSMQAASRSHLAFAATSVRQQMLQFLSVSRAEAVLPSFRSALRRIALRRIASALSAGGWDAPPATTRDTPNKASRFTQSTGRCRGAACRCLSGLDFL